MLNKQGDLDGPYNPNPFRSPDLENGEDPDGLSGDDHGPPLNLPKRKTRWVKFKLTVLNRGYVPLVLRFISFIFSVAALFIAAYITRFSARADVGTRPSTVMAFVVNGCALVYLPWVAKDEYFGQAIGIRSPKHKLRLVLLDLLFIMLNSADLALAFNVLYDSEAGCITDMNTFDTPASKRVCMLQQSMAAVLFITLMGFVINFTVSLYRLVERIITTA